MPAWIEEYEDTAEVSMGAAAVPREPGLLCTRIVVSGAASAAHTLNARTRLVAISCDEGISVIFAAVPVATTSHRRMEAGQTEYRGVIAGASNTKISIISNP